MKSFMVRFTAPPVYKNIAPIKQLNYMMNGDGRVSEWQPEVVSEEVLEIYRDPTAEMRHENIELKRCLVAALELCKTMAGVMVGRAE